MSSPTPAISAAGRSRSPSHRDDVWLGSYEAGANISGVLLVTELESNHP